GQFSPREASRAAATRAVARLRHRGPDASAIWQSDDGRLVLGHTRLKIIDLSDAANQPVVSPDVRWVLIYNGEIFNFADVRRKFNGGWNFRTGSDSEVLLATFAAKGLAAMHDWIGMFAFAMLDQVACKLYLVRDRFGIKPLYWVRTPDGGFAFASEIPALLDLLGSVRADDDVIRTYLETGVYESGAHTFFKDVRALEPGCAATIDLASGAWEMTRWYRLADHVQDLSGIGEEELVARGAGLVETAIRDHLVADVKVGINVSGGVDSSLLVAQTKRSLTDVHAFTQDYEEPYSEAKWVREAADGCHLHISALDSGSIRALLPEVVEGQAEPFGGVTVCGYDPLYAEADRAGVTVLLDGNGADETFLGYQSYHAAYVHSLENGAQREAADGYRSFWGSGPPHVTNGQAIDGTVAVNASVIADDLRRRASVLEVTDTGTFADPVKTMAARDLLAAKIPRGLRFNDRMSMARSKELRVPYLDHRLVEFGFGVPTRYLLNRHGSKALFRKIAARFVPPSIATATKRSVQSPQREWLANEWRDLVTDIISSPSFAGRGWIDPKRAQAAYEQFRQGERANSFYIWQWINLELWARAFLD
ncbi:MAG: asparagine synthase (glutamine-hydrolyzing), partial [Pseudolabrys sp.]